MTSVFIYCNRSLADDLPAYKPQALVSTKFPVVLKLASTPGIDGVSEIRLLWIVVTSESMELTPAGEVGAEFATGTGVAATPAPRKLNSDPSELDEPLPAALTPLSDPSRAARVSAPPTPPCKPLSKPLAIVASAARVTVAAGAAGAAGTAGAVCRALVYAPNADCASATLPAFSAAPTWFTSVLKPLLAAGLGSARSTSLL